MSVPGVIERDLLSDEISIYFDNRKPIPLSALATFLGKLDQASRDVDGMQGMFLELSDFALGSNELRFRVVGPGRLDREQAEREERNAKANERSARWAAVSAGAGVVSAVAAAITIAISNGSANPSSHRIVNNYDISNIYVRAPCEDAHVIERATIIQGHYRRRGEKQQQKEELLETENQEFLQAMNHEQIIDIAGWIFADTRGGYSFETINGNKFKLRNRPPGAFGSEAVAVRVAVFQGPDRLELEIVDIITYLSNL